MMKAMVSPKGQAGFSVLKEPRGFKGDTENRKYSQQLILSKEEGEKFITFLTKEAEKLQAVEVERQRAKGKVLRTSPAELSYKPQLDGTYSFSFNRKEQDGPPQAVDSAHAPLVDYLTREHEIQVAYTLKPYVKAGAVFGVSLVLLAVKAFGRSTMTMDASELFGKADVAEVTKSVDLKDLF